jgi:hypothetical protein
MPHFFISLNINPIKKYWRRIKQALYRRPHQSINKAEIKIVIYYKPLLRPKARAWGHYVTENPMACDEVTWRSRDGS